MTLLYSKDELLKWINLNPHNNLEEKINTEMVRPKKILSKRVSLKSDVNDENNLESEENKNKENANQNLPFRRGEGFCTRCLIF
jgi:hypothetical protein